LSGGLKAVSHRQPVGLTFLIPILLISVLNYRLDDLLYLNFVFFA
jgi:hypothetical protein